MKIKGRFTVQSIGNEYYAIPLSGSTKNSLMLSLNESGAFLFKRLINGDTEDGLVSALLSEYDVSKDKAVSDVSAFIERMKKAELLDE